MVRLRLLLVVATTIASTVWRNCGAQTTADVDGCVPPTFDEVEDLLQGYIEIIASEGTPPVVSISTVYVNCMSVGRIRDQFREITYTLVYTTEGSSFIRIGYADVACVQQSWVLGDSFTSDDMGLQNNDTVTDCGRCSGFVPGFNATTHCIACDDSCFEVGFDLCYGVPSAANNNDTLCCNFYDSDVCVAECPPGTLADANNDCIPCNLTCNNNFQPFPNCTACNCSFPFFGMYCQFEVDECEPNPCQNGGNCTDDPGPGFTCMCDEGYTGQFCEMDIDDCASDPCVNGGTCEDRVAAYVCICPPDFTGDNCEIVIDDCDPNPCKNGGVCIDGINSYTCNCSDNFEGEMCEICSLPNCEVCSLDDGVCLRCIPQFVLNDVGQCVVDCSHCGSEETTFKRDVCTFYCQLEAWRSQANACNFSISEIEVPSSNLPENDLFTAAAEEQQRLDVEWRSEAQGLGLEIEDREPSTITGEAEEWRTDTRAYVEQLQEWFNYAVSIDPTFPSLDFDSITRSLEGEDLSDVYNSLLDAYSVGVVAFNNGISRDFCEA